MNCATISHGSRLRVRPSRPVAQKSHAIAQPAWLDRQTVNRPAASSGMRTASTNAPSCNRKRYFTKPSEGSVARSSRPVPRSVEAAVDALIDLEFSSIDQRIDCCFDGTRNWTRRWMSIASMRNRMRSNAPRLGITNGDAVGAQVRCEIFGQHPEQVGHHGMHILRSCHPERESRDLGGWAARSPRISPHTRPGPSTHARHDNPAYARNASTGCKRAALIDGYNPANNPTLTANPVEIRIPNIDTGSPAGKKPLIAFTRAMPSPRPTAAPATDNVIDSIRNWRKISLSFAPIDLRRPISKSRSEIEILSTEKIPTPPISSDTPAIAKNTMRQLRRITSMSARSFRISLPTLLMRVSPIPLC